MSTTTLNQVLVFEDANLKSLISLLLRGAIGGLIGWLCWGSGLEISRLSGLLFLPFLWALAPSRWSAGILMLGYYLAGARGLPGGIGVFFGDSTPWWSGCLLWLMTAILLTLPFLLLWSSRSNGRRVIGFVIALCMSAIPPLGLIGWINPLSVAGVLFPGCGWIGLAMTVGLMSAIVGERSWGWKWIILFMGLAAVANASSPAWRIAPPAGWQGVDTRFSRLGSGGSDDAGVMLATMRRVEWVKAFLDAVPENSVRVLPETILGAFGPMAEWKLDDAVGRLRARGSRVLVGAELYVSDYRYKNAVMIFGASNGEKREAVQGIPVPVSMWKPWTSDGAVANVWGGGSAIEVNGKRVSVVVCYEQFLLFSMLKAMVSKPDVLVGVANVWWIRDASMPVVQGQMMQAFGRLFGVPVVSARNF